MAKANITYDEVVSAAQELERLGEKLNPERIKEMLGNRGSMAAINRYIKEWKGQAEPGKASSEQTFDLAGETMQQPLNLNTDDEGNQSNASVQAKAEQDAGNTIDPQEIAPAQGLVQDESQSSSNYQTEPAKAAIQVRSPAPLEEPKETCQPERLEDLDDNALIIKIRRLETQLAKEQSRREAAEKMAEEAKEYADIIKEQIGQRVADLRQSMEVMINQLKAEARDMKQNADNDLRFYRDQLQKANVKIVSMLTGQAPEQASGAEVTSATGSTGSALE